MGAATIPACSTRSSPPSTTLTARRPDPGGTTAASERQVPRREPTPRPVTPQRTDWRKRMPARLDLIGIVVHDMAKSLAFYRRLGLDVPADADAEGHVETTLPGGLRLAWDTVETIKSFDPSWTPPSGGVRIGLAFLCDSPAEVDQTYA